MPVSLATSFQVDLREPWVEEHNREVRDVWAAFEADQPTRVPVIFSGARTQYMSENQINRILPSKIFDPETHKVINETSLIAQRATMNQKLKWKENDSQEEI